MTDARAVKTRPVIGLLTDFGLVDPYVAEMKAVIASICPQAMMIDISHLVEKFDIRMGAFLLASSTGAFPDGSVFVAVVDPGVGSGRRPIVIETSRSIYVGPDNGVLIPAAQSEDMRGVFEITNRSLTRADISTTFHGRDIFAPVAAHIACGVRPQDCGPRIMDYVDPSYSQPKLDDATATCEILHIDRFGNVITNLRNTQLSALSLTQGQQVRLVFRKGRILGRYVRTYSDLKTKRDVGLLAGSHGFVEIACRESEAAKRIRVRTGMTVRISGA
jgi:S-adenosylmethionine hydrolase